jgi:hypothetical protein
MSTSLAHPPIGPWSARAWPAGLPAGRGSSWVGLGAPLLAMDGPLPDGAQIAAADAYSQAGDEWASAEYRREMASLLTLRALDRLTEPVL